MKSSTSLAYQIHFCSSEDPSHPIAAIQNSSLRSLGWQSSTTPRFPVEFVIDLMSIVELDTIQFVSHQYKIPTRIDLYVAGSDQRFQALGSFQFSDNSFTQYTSKELKSVSLNGIKAQYLKISIPGCHANANNSGNQVGLVSLNVVGVGGTPKSSATSFQAPSQPGDSSDLLEQLERQKKEAVSREDFKAAEALKIQIDRLRRAYDQVMILQKQKKEAVEKEDFVTAQRLKDEINTLLTGQPSNPQIPESRPPKQLPQQIEEKPSPKRKPVEQPPAPPVERPKLEQPPVEPPVKKKKVDVAPEDEEPPIRVEAAGPPDERPIHPAAPSEPVEEVRPERKAINPKSCGSDALATDPDPLSPENAQEAGNLIDLFGQKQIACFFSKAWNLRVQGIQELSKLIIGLKDDQANAFYKYCYICRHRVQETHKAVFQAALDGIQACGDALNLSQPDLLRGINQMIGQLQQKVGCAQQPLSKLSCKFLLWLASKDCYDVVIPILLKDSNSKDWRAAYSQVKTLHKLILKKGDLKSIPGLTLQSVMAFLVPCLESPKNEVRSTSTELVVTLELLFGSTIYQYLDKLPQRTKGAITDAIKASKTATGQIGEQSPKQATEEEG